MYAVLMLTHVILFVGLQKNKVIIREYHFTDRTDTDKKKTNKKKNNLHKQIPVQ